MSDLAARGLAWTTVAAMLAALLLGGMHPAAAGLFDHPWDKLAHLGYFLVLALLLMQAIPGRWRLGLALALLIGAADELHQLLLPGREPGIVDWLADFCGAGIGLFLHRACNGPAGGEKEAIPVGQDASKSRRGPA